MYSLDNSNYTFVINAKILKNYMSSTGVILRCKISFNLNNLF